MIEVQNCWSRQQSIDSIAYELNLSFNKKTVWTQQEKKDIKQMLNDAYSKNGIFRHKMDNEYNIIHVIKEIHTTEAGRHFNIQLFHNPDISIKPRFTPLGTLSSTIHCKVSTDFGKNYISKFSEIVEWI